MTTTATPNARALRPWRTAADLIGRVGGASCEVVLHDLADPVHSVVYVVNGVITNRRVGQGFRHLIVEMLNSAAEKEGGGDLLKDWWFRHEGRLIRCVTQLIRSESGELIGALCVNQDVTDDLQVFERLKTLLPGLAGVSPALEAEGALGASAAAMSPGVSRDAPLELPAATDRPMFAPKEGILSAVQRLIDGIVAGGAAHPEGGQRTRAERLELLAFMDERGVFLVKGALEHAALRLGVSKVTLYSDLDQLRREAGVVKNGSSNKGEKK